MAWNQKTQSHAEPQKKRRGLLIACASGAVLLAAIVAFCFVRSQPKAADEPLTESVPHKQIAAQPVGTNRADKVRERRSSSRKDRKDDKETAAKRRAAFQRKMQMANREEYSPEEQKVLDSVRAALDENDLVRTRAAAADALVNANAKIRLEAVQALGWFGDKALVELTKAMGDKNPDVAEAARDQVEQALSGMENSHQAFVLASSYIAAADPESATMLLGILESKGCEITEPDDSDSADDVASARARRQDIVTALSGLIEGGGEIAKAARSAYKTITDEEWRDLSSADAWANGIPDPQPPAEEEPTEEPAENP